MSCLHLTCRAYWPNFSSFSNEGCCGERCLCAYTSFDVYAFKLDSFWSLPSVRDNASIMLQFPGNDAQLLYCITSIQAKKFIFLPICWIITHCAFFFYHCGKTSIIRVRLAPMSGACLQGFGGQWLGIGTGFP